MVNDDYTSKLRSEINNCKLKEITCDFPVAGG
jgi:hypothetical protein